MCEVLGEWSGIRSLGGNSSTWQGVKLAAILRVGCMCMCVCMYMCVYVCVCMYVCVCVYVYVGVCVCMYNVCMCVHESISPPTTYVSSLFVILKLLYTS